MNGLCACGCGEPAPIATMTNKRWGHVRGQPVRFIHGHHLRKSAPIIDDADLLWLAGLLEGEGSFIVTHRERRPARSDPWTQMGARLFVGMTDKDVIARAASLLGVKVGIRNRDDGIRQIIYHAALSGPRAYALMRRLRPNMGKRRQAAIDQALATEGKRAWPHDL